MAALDKSYIALRKNLGDGWKVVMFKENGTDKGETTLASLCGGNMGKVLAMTVIHQASIMTMINNIKIED